MIKRSSLMLATLVAGVTFTAPSLAAESKATFSVDQKKQIETVVHDYLINNPEILIQMTQTLQQQESKKRSEQALTAIPEHAEALFSSSFSPMQGNPNGTVTLVEFFDYQCGHCRHMEPTLEALPGKHDNLRIIYKVFPIFGAGSEFASRAALAAKLQGKFFEMHKALMAVKPPLNEKNVLEAAKSVGLDVKKLQKDIKGPDVNAEIKSNFELAKALGIMGTPSLVISNPDIPATSTNQKDKKSVFVPGAVDANTLDNMLKDFS